MSEPQNGLSERLAKPPRHRGLRKALLFIAVVMTAATIFWIHRLLSFDDINSATATSSQTNPSASPAANSPDPALPTTNTTTTEKAILVDGTPKNILVKYSGGMAKDSEGSSVKHGKWTYEYNIKIMEGQYNMGIREGQWRGWYPSGEKAFEGTMKKNVKNGLWTFSYKNGAKEAEGNYDNGAYSGPWKYWFENGKIRCEGMFNNGNKTGSWRFYNRKGEITSIFKYDSEGKQVASTNYPASKYEEDLTNDYFSVTPMGDPRNSSDLELFSHDNPSWMR